MASPTDRKASHDAEKDAMALELDNVPDTKLDVELNEAAMDAELQQLEEEFQALPKPRFDLALGSPAVFTYILVGFASLGGLLSGLDQSLISGANLSMPDALHLSAGQASLANAGMPLGAVAGALILSPANEYLGRRMAIIVSCVLYTIGAALEAGAIDFGMMFAGRFVLGMGVGLEGGTVPVYVAECGMYTREIIPNSELQNPTSTNIISSPNQNPRQPSLAIPIKHRTGRSTRIRRGRHLLRRQRKLALHPRIVPRLLHHPMGGHAIPPRKPSLPHAQRQNRRSLRRLETHPRLHHARSKGRVPRHETSRRRRKP